MQKIIDILEEKLIKYKSSLSSVEGIYNFGSKSSIPIKEDVFTLNQIHSDKVIFLKNTDKNYEPFDGDAIITTQKGFNIGVKLLIVSQYY